MKKNRPKNYLIYWNSYRYMRQIMRTPQSEHQTVPRELSWDCYELFYLYMRQHLGPRPSHRHRLARINTDRGFIEGNLCWDIPAVMMQRSHGAHRLRYKNRTFSLRQLADHTGIEYHRLRRSLKKYGQVATAIRYAR